MCSFSNKLFTQLPPLITADLLSDLIVKTFGCLNRLCSFRFQGTSLLRDSSQLTAVTTNPSVSVLYKSTSPNLKPKLLQHLSPSCRLGSVSDSGSWKKDEHLLWPSVHVLLFLSFHRLNVKPGLYFISSFTRQPTAPMGHLHVYRWVTAAHEHPLQVHRSFYCELAFSF